MEAAKTNLKIFDAHAHVLPAGPRLNDGSYDVSDDFNFRMNLMKKCGFRATILMASHIYERPAGVLDTRRQNDFVAWYRDTHSDVFPVGIGTIEPSHGVAAGLAELHRIKEELRLDGVVWHHLFNGSVIDDQRMIAFARELVDLNLPAFVHVNSGGPAESPSHVESLALQVPDLTLIVVGAFSGHENMLGMRLLASQCPNVFFDTSLAWPMAQPILAHAERFGTSRLIFGTDMHFNPKGIWSYPTGLVDILTSDRITEKGREDILWGNAQRLFPVIGDLS